MILFFFHIPKTAGSSITIKAQSTLSRAYTVLIHNPSAARLPARLRKLSNHREIYFVQGHISPSPELFSIPMRRVTVLRQPLQRLISHFCYSFDRRFYDLRQLEFFRGRRNYQAARFDGEDLVAWIERFSMDDFQVRFLAGHYDVPITEDVESRALETLRCLDFVATMENLGELFTVLSAMTGKEFNTAQTPHNNKSNRSFLKVSRNDLEYLEANFCQRDNRILLHIGGHRPGMYDDCIQRVPERAAVAKRRDLGRIFDLILANTTVEETLFRMKRKGISMTARGVDVVKNIIS